ncbi:MAG: hypothetical protein ACYS22_16685, partial [Planctomycetota bacterium]
MSGALALLSSIAAPAFGQLTPLGLDDSDDPAADLMFEEPRLELSEALDLLDQGVRDGDYRLAARMAQRLLESEQGRVRGAVVSVLDEASLPIEARSSVPYLRGIAPAVHERLRNLPPRGLRAYRSLFDGRAEGLIEEARSQPGPSELRRVLPLVIMTSHGTSAALELGDRCLEEGDLSGAASAYGQVQQLGAEASGLVAPRVAHVRARSAQALRGGEATAWPDPAQLEAALLALPEKPEPFVTGADGKVSTSLRGGQHLVRLESSEGPALAVVSPTKLLVARPGKRLRDVPKGVAPGDGAAARRTGAVSYGDHWLATLSHGRRAYSKRPRWVPFGSRSGSSGSVEMRTDLFCLDRSAGDVVRWTTASPKDFDRPALLGGLEWPGRPTVQSGRLIAGARALGVEPELYVTAFLPQRPRLLWRTFLVTQLMPRTHSRASRSPHVEVAVLDHVAVCDTTLGAIFGIDVATGEVLWVTRRFAPRPGDVMAPQRSRVPNTKGPGLIAVPEASVCVRQDRASGTIEGLGVDGRIVFRVVASAPTRLLGRAGSLLVASDPGGLFLIDPRREGRRVSERLPLPSGGGQLVGDVVRIGDHLVIPLARQLLIVRIEPARQDPDAALPFFELAIVGARVLSQTRLVAAPLRFSETELLVPLAEQGVPSIQRIDLAAP